MTQPAHVHVSSGVPADCHDIIATYIKLAAMLANTDLSECEVHVKQGSRPAHGVLDTRGAMSGAAYFQYDELRRPGALIKAQPQGTRYALRVQEGMRYLVTLKLTRDFEHGVYPYRWHYRRYKTAAPCVFHDWTEELLHLTVHEFTHVAQYVNRWQRSELHCEHAAHEAVYKIRRVLASQREPQLESNLIGKAAAH